MTARTVRIVRAAQRFRTERDGVSTSHEFSFGDHYAPDRIRLGPLLAHNVEALPPGTGYEPHLHRDIEIVTWLYEGSLEHDDDRGHAARLDAPSVQRLDAAAGVTHSEVNPARDGAGPVTRFVQLWLDCASGADESDIGPSYAAEPVDPERMRQHLVALAAGPDTGVTEPCLTLRTPGVTVLAGIISSGGTRSLPDADILHLHVTQGAVRLRSGESARAEDSVVVRYGHAEHVTAEMDSQVLVLALDQ